RDAGEVVRRLDELAPLPIAHDRRRRRARRAAIAAAATLAIGALAAAAVTRAPDPPAPPAIPPRFALPAPDPAPLPDRHRWPGAVVQRLISDELIDAWGLDVELGAPAQPAPGTLAIAGQLARDPSGRLRLRLDGGVIEAGSPRELALAAAAHLVDR